MKKCILVLCMVAGLCLPASISPAASRVPPHSISRSKQFTAYSEVAEARGEVCSLAEDLKTRVHRSLGLPATWRLPVTILLMPTRTANEPASASLRYLKGGPGASSLIRIDFKAGSGMEELLKERLLEAILIDVASSGAAGAEARTIAIPEWLIQGFIGITELGEVGHPAAATFVGLFEANKVPTLRDFIDQDPRRLDAAGRQLYRGFSTTLVRLLLELPDGQKQMVRFLHSIPTGKVGSHRSLLAFFPALGGTDVSAQRWWKLAVARISARYGRGPMSLEATERELAAALKVRLDQPDGSIQVFDLDDFEQFRRSRQRHTALASMRYELQRVAVRSHPLTLPIVLSYIDLSNRIQKGTRRGTAEELQALAELRQEILQRGAEIEDFMNWYEATQLPTASGAFAGYFNLLRQLEGNQQAHVDPIRRYVDGLERELE